MRSNAAFFGAAIVCFCASLASAQQLPEFKVGDAVDVYTFGKWVPCTIASPLASNAYGVHCGSLDLQAKANPQELRAHVAALDGVRQVVAIPRLGAAEEDAAPQGESVGARYGTRDPRTCDRRMASLSADDAKQLFICDAEREFDGSLYLVAEVSVQVSKPRPFDPKEDASKTGIDNSQPVIDLRATYDNYQCSPLPASHMDNPGNRNCTEFKISSAAGGCYKNAAGEWHCIASDLHPAASATVKNVKPPTDEN